MKCFWCLTGEGPKGARLHPASGQNLQYAPCGSCQDHMDMGVVIVEVVDNPENDARVGLRLDVDRVVFPTGVWAVATPGFIRQVMSPAAVDQVLHDDHGYCFVSQEVWDAMGLERPEVTEAT